MSRAMASKRAMSRAGPEGVCLFRMSMRGRTDIEKKEKRNGELETEHYHISELSSS